MDGGEVVVMARKSESIIVLVLVAFSVLPTAQRAVQPVHFLLDASRRDLEQRHDCPLQLCASAATVKAQGTHSVFSAQQTREEPWEDKLLAGEQLLDAVALGGCAEARGAVVPDDGQPTLCGKLGNVALSAEAARWGNNSMRAKRVSGQC